MRTLKRERKERMAVLVDAEGKIASEVAAGAAAVLALAGQPATAQA